ncbi:fumarate reductase subunit FrdD [Halomonas daqiaonensis]|uniref:Fumarate reductase subunit D n=1 Tax=Halomonas daqiaonensis TaxID=650850 RepID=A0A1H7SKR9_9GAMM|nr:fumarate reductase subunit FrdD [Halomonas daqiaonensis]SEL73103.1 succinate dehydrogenase subunit D [Halomonas daqiaonensis]
MRKSTSDNIKRSDEPIWWGLFSAGGVCFAVFVPAAILFIALLIPAGIMAPEALSFERAESMIFSLPGLIFIGVVVCLPLFHAAHRIRHGLHDLKLGKEQLNKIVTYGSAALLSALALVGFVIGIM